jgi:hypothetical protein
MYDTDVNVEQAEYDTDFPPQVTGAIELYAAIDTAAFEGNCYILLHDSSDTVLVYSRIAEGLYQNKLTNVGHIFSTISPYTTNKFIHIRIEFDCNTDQVHYYVNGEDRGYFNMFNEGDSVTRLTFGSHTLGNGYNLYFDAVGCDANGYIPFSNYPPGQLDTSTTTSTDTSTDTTDTSTDTTTDDIDENGGIIFDFMWIFLLIGLISVGSVGYIVYSKSKNNLSLNDKKPPYQGQNLSYRSKISHPKTNLDKEYWIGVAKSAQKKLASGEIKHPFFTDPSPGPLNQPVVSPMIPNIAKTSASGSIIDKTFKKHENRQLLERILKVSKRIKINYLRDIMKIPPAKFNLLLIDWAEQYNLVIDGDYLEVSAETVNDFIKELDASFTDWDAKEANHIGKME